VERAIGTVSYLLTLAVSALLSGITQFFWSLALYISTQDERML
jgi:hypothetical protein